MKKLLPLIFLTFPLLYACNSQEDSVEKWKNEIVETEKEFAAMAQKEGIPKAFMAFAAEDVVVMRDNTLVIGKEGLRESFQGSPENVSLSWKPDFVDVAASGDLGYTYGKYIYTLTDSLGNENVAEGIFHTVWKRQADGSWKFVWD
ncbi:MAG: nuclear transport factor 2 family protein [Bacteroidia bacterium]|nr:MAG: nuclear transport factor 2 family protein [Bacteroidia bacterium]